MASADQWLSAVAQLIGILLILAMIIYTHSQRGGKDD